MSDFRFGVYRHYKGALYQATELGQDANADELAVGEYGYPGFWKGPLEARVVVIYRPLQVSAKHLGLPTVIRTLEHFTGLVELDAAGVGAIIELNQSFSLSPVELVIPFEGEGASARRFTYLGPELTPEMLG